MAKKCKTGEIINVRDSQDVPWDEAIFLFENAGTASCVERGQEDQFGRNNSFNIQC